MTPSSDQTEIRSTVEPANWLPSPSSPEYPKFRRAINYIRQLGDPALVTKARPVAQFDDLLGQQIAWMTSILDDVDGAGLAAPQLGTLQRMFIYRQWDSETHRPLPIEVIINPEMIDLAADQVEMAEGCLSIPGVTIHILRPSWIEFSHYDSQGNYHEKRLDGPQARVVQHEWDHLDGRLITHFIRGGDRRLALDLFDQTTIHLQKNP